MTPVQKTEHRAKEQRHSISIEYNGKDFVYTHGETQRPANVLHVKRGDVVRWSCDHGNFSVLFKKESPFSHVGLHGRKGENTNDAIVTGDANRYEYAVSVAHHDGRMLVDDPEIIVGQ
jgi:hypothetical protein